MYITWGFTIVWVPHSQPPKSRIPPPTHTDPGIRIWMGGYVTRTAQSLPQQCGGRFGGSQRPGCPSQPPSVPERGAREGETPYQEHFCPFLSHEAFAGGSRLFGCPIPKTPHSGMRMQREKYITGNGSAPSWMTSSMEWVRIWGFTVVGAPFPTSQIQGRDTGSRYREGLSPFLDAKTPGSGINHWDKPQG